MRRTFALATIAFVAGVGIGYFAQSAGIRSPRRTETHATDLAAIEKLHQEDIEATLSQDPRGLIDIWTVDAVRFNPAGLPTVGKQAIQVENQKIHTQYPGLKMLSYTPKYKNIQIEDGLACEWFEREGEYKLSSESPLTNWHAKGLQALKRQSDGSWKFALIMSQMD
jgi:ketosteroid isomerase-like protein